VDEEGLLEPDLRLIRGGASESTAPAGRDREECNRARSSAGARAVIGPPPPRGSRRSRKQGPPIQRSSSKGTISAQVACASSVRVLPAHPGTRRKPGCAPPPRWGDRETVEGIGHRIVLRGGGETEGEAVHAVGGIRKDVEGWAVLPTWTVIGRSGTAGSSLGSLGRSRTASASPSSRVTTARLSMPMKRVPLSVR